MTPVLSALSRRLSHSAQAPAWLAALGAALLVLLLQAAGAWRPFERMAFDQAATGGAPFALKDVVLVAIDDASTARLGPWPWPREQLARLVERVSVAGARSVVLVADLSEPPESPALAQAIARSGRTLLALQPAGAASGEAGGLGASAAAASTPASAAAGVVGVLPALAAGAVALGHVDWLIDTDGVARRVALVPQGDAFAAPALALLAATRQVDRRDQGRPVLAGRELQLGAVHLRLDDGGALAPRWPARGEVPGVARESAHVLLGQGGAATRYAGKVVLIGPTLPGAPAVDTPARAAVPQVEAQAQLVSSLLGGHVLRAPALAPVLGVLLALGGAAVVVALQQRYAAPSCWVLVGLGSLLAVVLAVLAGQLWGLWLPLLVPALAWLAAMGGVQLMQRHLQRPGVAMLQPAPAPAAGSPAAGAAPVPASDGAATAAPEPAFAATVLDPQALREVPHVGRYPLVREVARGALGSVYLARDPQTQYPVAVKTMALSAWFQGGDLAEARRALERSAEAAATLRHPDIGATLDCGEDGGLDHVVSEWIDGEDLGHLLKSGAPPSVAGLLRTHARVAKAVAYAHRQGVVHGALRPSQIMVDAATQRVLVLGFACGGLVREVVLRAQAETTLGLLAPELVQPRRPGGEVMLAAQPSADVYGLAALLYLALAGRPPRQGDVPVPDLHATRPDLPDALADLLHGALDPRPHRRPHDALAFADGLRAVLETMGVAPSRPQVLPDVN